MSWWRKKPTARAEDSTGDRRMPLVRLEGITKIFKGDPDEGGILKQAVKGMMDSLMPHRD